MLTRGVYGGALVSKVNPVPDFKWNIGGREVRTDANVTLFTGFVIVLLTAVICLALV